MWWWRWQCPLSHTGLEVLMRDLTYSRCQLHCTCFGPGAPTCEPRQQHPLAPGEPTLWPPSPLTQASFVFLPADAQHPFAATQALLQPKPTRVPRKDIWPQHTLNVKEGKISIPRITDGRRKTTDGSVIPASSLHFGWQEAGQGGWFLPGKEKS